MSQKQSGTITIPPTATATEAAAIAAALDGYLKTESRDTEPEIETWEGKRFQFGGRATELTGTSRRVPRSAPTDEWTALGRVDRFKR